MTKSSLIIKLTHCIFPLQVLAQGIRDYAEFAKFEASQISQMMMHSFTHGFGTLYIHILVLENVETLR